MLNNISKQTEYDSGRTGSNVAGRKRHRGADPDITEQQVIAIFNRIDSFSEENKKHAALSLKTYWETRVKWKKKDCSKKQWVKVQKIKTILGDE